MLGETEKPLKYYEIKEVDRALFVDWQRSSSTNLRARIKWTMTTSSVKAECLLPSKPVDADGLVKVTVQTREGVFEFPCRKDEALLHGGLKSGTGVALRVRHRNVRHLPREAHVGRVRVGWEESRLGEA